MIKIILTLGFIPCVAAFSTLRDSTSYFPDIQRALDCANHYGLCAIDELVDLSEELDAFLECNLENGGPEWEVSGEPYHAPVDILSEELLQQEACEEEIVDRQYLSEALLQQGERLEHDMVMAAQQGSFLTSSNTYDYVVNNDAYDETPPRTENPFVWDGAASS